MTLAIPKVWGYDLTILERPDFQIHEIQFKKGGVCSEHLHEHRFNAFHCLAGRLIIRIWDREHDDPPSVIELRGGQTTIIPPGVFHQFEAVTDGIALEVYWTEGPQANDIYRRTQGFKRIEPEAVKVPGEEPVKPEAEKALVH